MVLSTLLVIASYLALPQNIPMASQFDIDRAVSAIRLASFAYCSGSAITSKSCRTCGASDLQALQKITTGTGSDLNWYVGYESSKNTIKIAFRGTNSIQNWVTNSKATFTNFDGVRVHLGWFGDYMDVQPRVQSQMTALIRSHPTASILFTGHSTGGVYATLAAFQGTVSGGWLSSLVPRNKIYIITAGSPRIGDQSFVNAIHNRGFGSIVRVSNAVDVATQSPPSSLGYVHFRREMNVNSNTPYFCDQEPSGTSALGSCANRYEGPKLLAQPGEVLGRHMRYLGISFLDVC
jgi:hypothetical protein